MNTLSPLESIYEGNPPFQPLISAFFQGIPDRLELIAAAIRSGDVALMNQLLHKFKGAAMTFGIPPLAQALHDVEQRFLEHFSQPDGGNRLDQCSESYNTLVSLCASLSTQGVLVLADRPMFAHAGSLIEKPLL